MLRSLNCMAFHLQFIRGRSFGSAGLRVVDVLCFFKYL